MIHVSARLSDVNTIFPTPTYEIVLSGSTVTVRPGFGLFATIPGGGEVSRSVDLSSFSQGTDTWGRLKDKNVVHLKATGEVDILCRVPTYSSNSLEEIPWGTRISGRDFTVVVPVWSVVRFRQTYWYRYGIYGDCHFVDWVFFYGAEVVILRTVEIPPLMELGPYPWSTWTEVLGSKRYGTLRRYSAANGVLYSQELPFTFLDQSHIATGGSSYEISEDGLRPLAVPLYSGSIAPLVPSGYAADVDPGTALTLYCSYLEQGGGYESLQFVRPEDFDFGDLSVQCLDQAKAVDENVLFLVFDARDLTNFVKTSSRIKLIPAFQAGVERYLRDTRSGVSPKSALATLRRIGGAYLFKKYAVDSFLRDLKRFTAGLGELAGKLSEVTRLHARREASIVASTGKTVDYRAVLTVETTKYPQGMLYRVQNAILQMKSLGVYPRLTDLWDIVPYSFVLDWFWDFGDLLDDAADYLDVKDYFPVDHCVLSEKWTVAIDAAEMCPPEYIGWVSGVVEYSYYSRWNQRAVPLPPVSSGWGSGLTDRWVEAGALVLQRKGGFHYRP